MDFERFHQQLLNCSMTREEIQKFVADLARLRLGHIIRDLRTLEGDREDNDSEQSLQALDWNDATKLHASGIEKSWLRGITQPQRVYLHIDLPERHWNQVSRYLESTFLSSKQLDLLLPLLGRARAPIPKEWADKSFHAQIHEEIRLLNSLIHWALSSGVSVTTFRRYMAHLRIHGASQNYAGIVGAVGGMLAIFEALNEIAPGRIAEIHPQSWPVNVRCPWEIDKYLYQADDSKAGRPVQSILLDNGRAVVFASDPDVAIFQSLSTPYTSALEAYTAWNTVRRDVVGRAHKVHQFAVGEIKTATDSRSLHERFALSSRETRQEVGAPRFLLMAVLTHEILTGDNAGSRRRKGPGLANKDVERLSDIFNLYFCWGYDGARERHAEHWKQFKQRLAEWCGLD